MEGKSYSTEYGNRCRQIRMAKGMSQQALAEKMNTTPQNVSKWERDGISNVDTIMQLSEVLGQDITADEIDQEGSVGEIGKEILLELIKNEGYCEFSYFENNLFGLASDRISNELFKLERIGNVVREQYKDWLDQERDGVFITAKGIITIKNMELLLNPNCLHKVVSYERRINSCINFNDRIQKDEINRLLWSLTAIHSSYRVAYIGFLLEKYREMFPNQNMDMESKLYHQYLLPKEDCFFDTLYFMAFGLENADFEIDDGREELYDMLEDKEDKEIYIAAKKKGAKYIDWHTKHTQSIFEEMFPFIGNRLQDVEIQSKKIEDEVEDGLVRESLSMIRPSDYLGDNASAWQRLFEENVGSNRDKLCDEWFSNEQISVFIDNNYQPAKTDQEREVDMILDKINQLNPETLDYYYQFPESWEESGLAQKIRDTWKLPSRK